MNPSKRRRLKPGFTLIELLVVIAIIGLLVSMLLPAVQNAREAGRRASCLNNLLQLSIAMHNYEMAVGCYPPGSVNPSGPISNTPSGFHVSWVVSLLPYLEQHNAFVSFDMNSGAYSPLNRSLRTTPIPVLTCPSDWADRLTNGIATTNYVGIHHNTEAPIAADNNGILFLNSSVRYEQITDGSSQTLLLGEKPRGGDSLGWVSGTRDTLRNTSVFGPPVLPGQLTTPGDPRTVGGLAANHPGLINVAMADGSVRPMSAGTGAAILLAIGSRNDGQMVEF